MAADSTTASVADMITSKRLSYTVDFKMTVLKSLQEEFHGNKAACAKKHGIKRCMLQQWAVSHKSSCPCGNVCL